MNWLPFPFPTCPYCDSKWPRSRHRDCGPAGYFEVDPDRARVRCDGCWTESSVWSLTFFCSCGRTFESSEVRRALDDVLATVSLFDRLVRENLQEAAHARALGETSLRTWISGIAATLGGHLGGVLGTLAGKLANYFM